MFEDPPFRGRRAEVRRATEADDRRWHQVYVGGGEGGTALEKYGRENWVIYCFTAGGTVLNALGSEPVPYCGVADGRREHGAAAA